MVEEVSEDFLGGYSPLNEGNAINLNYFLAIITVGDSIKYFFFNIIILINPNDLEIL